MDEDGAFQVEEAAAEAEAALVIEVAVDLAVGVVVGAAEAGAFAMKALPMKSLVS